MMLVRKIAYIEGAIIIQHIMILDDDVNLTSSLSEYLAKKLPFHFVTFSEATVAIQALKETKFRFCAFILDIELSRQKNSGIEVAEVIRRDSQNFGKPIIFLTSYKHFGYGLLRHLHYYEFFTKETDYETIAKALQEAIQPESLYSKTESYVTISGINFDYELDLCNVSCIEQFGREVIVTDFRGKETLYKVKPRAFFSICQQIKEKNLSNYQQVHRSIVINLYRIQHIEWKKNTATIQLFNSTDFKPVGKTYLEKLRILKE